MRLSRKVFLQLLSRSTAILGFGFAVGALPPRKSWALSRDRTISAYLAVLIPNDQLGPGAVEVGTDKWMLHWAASDQGYADLLDGGCRWLDDQAKAIGGEDFAGLSEAERDRVVAVAAESEVGTKQRYFFDRTRRDAFLHFYEDPKSWPQIGYRGPPQPAGFMDYASPPERGE